MAQRRTFSEEFKREVVGLSRQPGAKISEVAHDIGIGANLLWRWRRELDTAGCGLPTKKPRVIAAFLRSG